MAGSDLPRWEQLKDLFAEALATPADGRAAWLARACGHDAGLRRDLQALVEAHDRSGEFLNTPAFATPAAARAVVAATERAADRAAPSRCGAYRIVRELGRGGMGIVYLGARDDERFEKLAAIKIVWTEYTHPTVIERFEQERRILAPLDHPNIARLLDAGTTDAGVPFVVMEYVDGEAIDAYCAAHGLSTRERLALFIQLCAAVQYSHQHLVVHRDIKTRNVLVTAQGVPKLLDFGIAKLLDADGRDGEATRSLFRTLTPETASPEQVRGEPVTVATDVYSLGVLLYRLLADRGPYRGALRTESDVVKAVCDEQPIRPSQVAPAGDVDRARSREIDGDLDLIALKALHKDPAQRYVSVEQLSADVSRHLDGRPVLARPDSVRYRAEMFVSRHRVGVIASALMLLLLIVGSAALAREAHVAHVQQALAERRFNDVRRLAHSFLFEFHDAIEKLPGSTQARELLVLRASEYLDNLSKESANDPTLQRELGEAYERVGDVQGLPGFANLGDTTGALASHRRAVGIREALTAGAADPALQRELAVSYSHLSTILRYTRDSKGALDFQRKSMVVREALLAREPGSRSAERSVAIAHHQLGEIMVQMGEWNPALDQFRIEATIFESLLAADPLNDTAQRDVALADKKIGALLERDGDLDAALAIYRKAVVLDEARGRTAPAPQTWLDLSFDYASVGHVCYMKHDTAGALQNDNRVLALRQQASAADPHDVNARDAVARAEQSLGLVMEDAGRFVEAQQHFRKALEVIADRYRTDPANGATGERLGAVYIQLTSTSAKTAMATRDTNEAQRLWREARDWCRLGIGVLETWSTKGTLTSLAKADLESLRIWMTRCDQAIR